jgi:hypothetical protein
MHGLGGNPLSCRNRRSTARHGLNSRGRRTRWGREDDRRGILSEGSCRSFHGRELSFDIASPVERTLAPESPKAHENAENAENAERNPTYDPAVGRPLGSYASIARRGGECGGFVGLRGTDAVAAQLGNGGGVR